MIKARCSTVKYKNITFAHLKLIPNHVSMFPWVCIYTEHLHEICSSVWIGGFVNIRWLEGPGLGIIAGITAISGTVFLLNCLPSATERGHGWRNDCVGVWCPPSFCVIVASPLYQILPGHQLLPDRHHLRHKTLPLRTTPPHPPNHPACSLFGAPVARLQSMKASSHCWNDCSDSGVFLIVRRDSYLACLTEPPPQSNIAGSIKCTNHKGLIKLHAALNMTLNNMILYSVCSSSLFLFLCKTSDIFQVTWHKSASIIE